MSNEPWDRTYRFLDGIGPNRLQGIDRYPEYPDDQDFSEAVLDPLSEAIGRYVKACTYLEIAIYRLRAQLDPDGGVSFEMAERHRVPASLKALRRMSDTMNEKERSHFSGLLDDAHHWLSLRHGVVHGIYRMNHQTRQHEGRRHVKNKETSKYELQREPYDRNSLMLAMTRATNTASQLFEGLDNWRAQIRRAAGHE